MCGICGFSGRQNDRVLHRMADVMTHRGPDDDGFYSDGRINFGFRRLSIVDLDTGNQPICNEDGTVWVVFNGEIYNHDQLRKQLVNRGHRFKTDHSDTEVIVHLYEEHGQNWPTFVNGMFGVALWNASKNSLFLYRDRIGKKPLYYATGNGQIIFGSEIKAVTRHPDVSSELDYAAIYSYFGTKNISAPLTAYCAIKQLLPGHCLKWESGDIDIRPYWQIDFSNPLTDISDHEAAAHLFDLFQDAVKIRMQCDVPYGAYLSGGVDSSAVTAMMSRHQSTPVKTFCLGYEDDPDGQFFGKAQDIEYARRMSKYWGTEHHEYIINADTFAEAMPDIMAAFDEPFSGTISTFFLSTLITRHVKVALSGDGADELFGSYLAHRLAFPIENYLKMKAGGFHHLHELDEEQSSRIHPFNTPDQFKFLSAIAADRISTWRNRLSVFSESERSELLTGGFRKIIDHKTQNVYCDIENRLTAGDALNRSLEIDQMELLPNQVLPFVDRLSMAHSVEVRVPYLDYRIIEFANRLPGRMKIYRGMVKYIHKEALKELLPTELLQRPKEGFVQPIYTWMHSHLKQWTKAQLMELPDTLFNMNHVNRLVQAFESGDQTINAKIWNLVCFSIWYRTRQSH